jgi:hypothetical protein
MHRGSGPKPNDSHREMTRATNRLCGATLAALLVALSAAGATAGEFRVTPASITFDRSFEQAQLLVTTLDAAGQITEKSDDLTSKAQFVSSNPAVATVDATGKILGHANGDAQITVTVEGVPQTVAVHVEGIQPVPQVGFVEQVLPILSRAGCNGGACHASQHGKGGFTLSVMGYDPSTECSVPSTCSIRPTACSSRSRRWPCRMGEAAASKSARPTIKSSRRGSPAELPRRDPTPPRSRRFS